MQRIGEKNFLINGEYQTLGSPYKNKLSERYNYFKEILHQSGENFSLFKFFSKPFNLKQITTKKEINFIAQKLLQGNGASLLNKKDLVDALTLKLGNTPQLRKDIHHVFKELTTEELKEIQQVAIHSSHADATLIAEALLNALETLKTKKEGALLEFPVHWEVKKPSLPNPPNRPTSIATKEEISQYHKELKAFKKEMKDYQFEKSNYYKNQAHVDRYYASCTTLEEKKVHYEQAYLTFCNQFKEGDLVFFKLDPSKFSVASAFSKKDYIDYTILQGQGLAKIWMSGDKNKESNSFIHVGMIVFEGDKLYLAEATPGDHGDDIRLIDLKEIALNGSSKQEFRVQRPQYGANEGAKVAKSMAQKIIYDENHQPLEITPLTKNSESTTSFQTAVRYSKKDAVTSLFGNSKFDKEATQDLFFLHAQKIKNSFALPKDEKGNRNFYCSYFIGFCLQNGQGQEALKKMLSDKDLQKLDAINENDTEGLKRWAKEMASEHHKKATDTITFQFDPRNMSPQRLRAYIHSHPDQFTPIARIVPAGNSKE